MTASTHSIPRNRRTLRLCLLSISLVFGLTGAAYAAKTDVLTMNNGDRLTGEVKRLQLGEVYFETSSYGNIRVKWKDIVRIQSDKHIVFETTDGERVFGELSDTAEPGELVVNTAQGDRSLDQQSIIYFEQISRDQSFWNRLDKHLKLGFSYTKASDIMRWNISTGLELRENTFRTDVELNSFVTNNNTGDDSRRGNFGASYTHYLSNRYLWLVSADVQTNDELGVDRRFIAMSGFGRYFVQTQSTEFSAIVGVAANRESSVGDEQDSSTTDTNLEGLIGLDWTFFKLSAPTSRYSVELELFPGITDSGRNRGNLNINFKQEFVDDLFCNLEFFSSYDSRR